MGVWFSKKADDKTHVASSVPRRGPPDEQLLQECVAQMPSSNAETKLIQQQVFHVLQGIYQRRQRVNVVFSAATGCGVEEYAMRFAQWTGGHYVHEIDSKYTANTDMLHELRSKALTNIKEPYQALLLHVADYLREVYMHMPEMQHTDTINTTQGGLYVYANSAMDHMNAMVLASVELGYLDVNALQILEQIGACVWKLSTSTCLPSYTIYVYIKYSDQHHREAFGAFLENTGPSHTLPDHGRSAQRWRDQVSQLQQHVAVSKRHLDNFYQQHQMVHNYQSVVLNCDDRVLLSLDHGAYICREVLSVVQQLQQLRIWGSTDQERIQFLQRSEWQGQRLRGVPLYITPRTDRSAAEQAAAFSRTAPFPIPSHAGLRTSSGVPSPAPQAVAVTTSNATKGSTRSTLEPRPVKL